MFESLRELMRSAVVRRRLLLIGVSLGVFHGFVLLAVACLAPRYPVLAGLALLAYGLGLRHAVDPDHIAAIDNTTRKLMQDGQQPLAVGFFFALGHSTIVIALCAAVAISASFLNSLPAYKSAGSLISTSISCCFLLGIGLVNLIVLSDTYRSWRKVVKGGAYSDVDLANQQNNRGLMARILKPVLKTVSKSWNMYWVGLLFGLGFDTASEVALVSISGSTGASGMPIYVVLLVPLAFTAGMCLIDTLDGVLMLGAYGWSFLKPLRKLYYNMTITCISVVIALGIGSVEALQIISKRFGLHGAIWALANNVQLGSWGYYIIGIFVLSWLGSMLLYRARGYDRLVR